MPNPNLNNKSEPEDIFSNIEPTKPREVPKRDALKKTEEMPIQEPFTPSSLPKGRRILGIILLIVIVVLLVGAGIFVFGSGYFNKNKNGDQNTTTTNKAQNINTPVIVNTVINVVPVNQVVDSDRDGLSDEEEKQFGTNPNKTDTDSDGLFDRDEVKVYKTDPKKPDTDSDGMTDGDEIKNGYNPNGPGKLIDLQNINK